MNVAFLRRKLIEDEDYTTASICVTHEEWARLEFKYMQLDEEDDLPFSGRDHPDGYNIILLHPETNELFWAYSCDFDFKDKTPIEELAENQTAEGLAKQLFPLCIDIPMDAVIETLIAYSDSHDGLQEERNLNFFCHQGVNGLLAIQIAERCIRSYNEFNADVMLNVVNYFGHQSIYYFAREGSVAVYVKPDRNLFLTPFDGFNADEISYEPRKGMFRIWWD